MRDIPIASTVLVSFVYLLLATTRLFASDAVLRSDSKLYDAPRTDAKVVAELKRTSRVIIQGRRQAWYQVKYGPVLQGWLPLASLQLVVGKGMTTYLNHLPSPAKATERDEDPRYSEAGDVSDTPITGIRALSNQTLANSQPDVEAVKSLERFAVNRSQASEFASELGLKTRELDYLVSTKKKPVEREKETREDE